MFEIKTHPVPESVSSRAHCDNEKYLAMYSHSIDDPDTFLGRASR